MYSDVQYKQIQYNRRFGVELEFGTVPKIKVRRTIEKISSHEILTTAYTPSYDTTCWHIKSDATCGTGGKGGVEVATFVAKSKNDLDHIANVADALSKCGCKVNPRCGLHIHYDGSDLLEENVGNILSYWLKIEKTIAAALPPHRRRNPFCRQQNCALFHESFFVSSQDVYELLKPQNLDCFHNSDRHLNLNLVNYARAVQNKNEIRKTLEFRWPEGSLDPDDIRHWVQLFLHFIETCKCKKMPSNFNYAELEESLEYMGLGHEGNTFTILDHDLFNLKTWFLQRIININKRNILYQNKVSTAKSILDDMHSLSRKFVA